MYPSFEIGTKTFSSYSIIISIGYIAFYLYSIFEARRNDMDTNHFKILGILNYFVSLLIFSNLLLKLSTHPDWLLNDPQRLFKFWEGGRSTFGFLISLFLVNWIYAIKIKISYLKLLDIYTPAIFLFGIIGRIGCLFGGCCFGSETTWFWAIPIDGINRHPLPVIESIVYLLLFMLSFFFKKKMKYNGQLFFFLFGTLYSVYIFIVEFLKDKHLTIFENVNVVQIFVVALFSLSVYKLIKPKKRI